MDSSNSHEVSFSSSRFGDAQLSERSTLSNDQHRARALENDQIVAASGLADGPNPSHSRMAKSTPKTSPSPPVAPMENKKEEKLAELLQVANGGFHAEKFSVGMDPHNHHRQVHTHQLVLPQEIVVSHSAITDLHDDGMSSLTDHELPQSGIATARPSHGSQFHPLQGCPEHHPLMPHENAHTQTPPMLASQEYRDYEEAQRWGGEEPTAPPFSIGGASSVTTPLLGASSSNLSIRRVGLQGLHWCNSFLSLKIPACFLLGLLLLAASGGLVHWPSLSGTGSKAPTPTPTSPPTLRPTISPVNPSRYDGLLDCASQLSEDEGMVRHNGTAQSNAVAWIYEKSEVKVPSTCSWSTEFGKLYALLVLKFALRVPDVSWGRLDQPYCLWKRIKCKYDGVTGQVVQLSLENANLFGSIPREISGLVHLEGLLLFSNPELVGSIPSEIGLVSSLKTLELHYSAMNGQVPTELGYLTDLEQLFIDHTAITGTVPKEVCSLPKLEPVHATTSLVECSCCNSLLE